MGGGVGGWACVWVCGWVGGWASMQDPFSDVESDEDSEIEMLECAEDAEMEEDDDDDDEGEAGAGGGGKQQPQVWIPGKGGEQPEHLEVDNSTYEMLHRMNVEWPMLRYASQKAPCECVDEYCFYT